MNQENHQLYYITRAAASRRLAQRAMNPAIAAIHAEFAAKYDELAGHANRGNQNMVTAVQPT